MMEGTARAQRARGLLLSQAYINGRIFSLKAYAYALVRIVYWLLRFPPAEHRATCKTRHL